eukprot:11621981-Alexandrium_andersonii.AAC.1
MLLIVAGSPCQQLATAGAGAGRLGLRGPTSVLFWATPSIAHLAQQLRPDVNVQVVVENAGSVR